MLPGETLVYPAHDYLGRTVSTIAEEREHNPCFARRSRDEFITIKSALGPDEEATDDIKRSASLAGEGVVEPRSQTLSQAQRNVINADDRNADRVATN